MDNQLFLKEMENTFNFNVSVSNDCVELETWTDGGVNMLITLLNVNDNYMEQLEKYIEEFDIDDEIQIMRESDNYKKNFTIRESLDDYEAYIEKLKDILSKLKGDEQETNDYQEIIGKLEAIKTNDLNTQTDYELIEEINSLIEKIENGYFV